MIDGHLFQVPNSSHGAGNITTDISGKNALIFGRTWHMANSAPELPDFFDLRVESNRRLEPLREISPEEWSKLQGWLKVHDCGLPMYKKGSRCAPRQAVQKKPTKC